jgi:hypothetical protein
MPPIAHVYLLCDEVVAIILIAIVFAQVGEVAGRNRSSHPEMPAQLMRANPFLDADKQHRAYHLQGHIPV